MSDFFLSDKKTWINYNGNTFIQGYYFFLLGGRVLWVVTFLGGC